MKTRVIMLVLLLTFLSVSYLSGEEDKRITATKDYEQTAQFFEKQAVRTQSLEVIGQVFTQQALRNAASKIREKKISMAETDVVVRCFVKRLPDLPSKYPDIPPAWQECWEVCLDAGHGSALTCYINCAAPKIP